MTNPETPESFAHWSNEEKWRFLLRHERLGELLITCGKLTVQQLEELLAKQKGTVKHVGEIIVEQGILSLDEILEALRWQHHSDQVGREAIAELKKHCHPKDTP